MTDNQKFDVVTLTWALGITAVLVAIRILVWGWAW